MLTKIKIQNIMCLSLLENYKLYKKYSLHLTTDTIPSNQNRNPNNPEGGNSKDSAEEKATQPDGVPELLEKKLEETAENFKYNDEIDEGENDIDIL
jgi:hypothetical protein